MVGGQLSLKILVNINKFCVAAKELNEEQHQVK